MGAFCGLLDDGVQYIKDVAKAISKTATGAAAGIDLSAMSATRLSQLGRDAVNSDMGSVAKRLLKSGIEDGVLTNDDTMKQLLKEGHYDKLIARASEIAGDTKLAGDTELYKTAIEKFNTKKALYDAFQNAGGTEEAAAAYFGREAGKGVGVLRTAQGFMSDPTRRKVAIGAYAGAAVGGRVLSGGSLTTNNRGERDIAGIPFI